METPINSTTQNVSHEAAAERILAILNEKPQYLESVSSTLDNLDNWQWATDETYEIGGGM